VPQSYKKEPKRVVTKEHPLRTSEEGNADFGFSAEG